MLDGYILNTQQLKKEGAVHQKKNDADDSSDSDNGIGNNTVRNSMWEKHDTHSIIFEAQSKLLLESPTRKDGKNNGSILEMPS